MRNKTFLTITLAVLLLATPVKADDEVADAVQTMITELGQARDSICASFPKSEKEIRSVECVLEFSELIDLLGETEQLMPVYEAAYIGLFASALAEASGEVPDESHIQRLGEDMRRYKEAYEKMCTAFTSVKERHFAPGVAEKRFSLRICE